MSQVERIEPGVYHCQDTVYVTTIYRKQQTRLFRN